MQPTAPSPPVPTAGTFDISLRTLLLDFDKPLVVGLLDERDWEVEANNVEWDPNTARVLGGNPFRVITTYTPGGAAADEVVRYSGVAGDLIGQNGLPVAPFVFPINVVP